MKEIKKTKKEITYSYDSSDERNEHITRLCKYYNKTCTGFSGDGKKKPLIAKFKIEE